MKRFKPLPNRDEYPTFMDNALAIHGSVSPKVFKQVVWTVLYASIISLIHFHSPWVHLPIGPFEYASLVMGLVLVFRINAGHDRWWEARKLWGNIVNKTRNFVMMSMHYVDDKEVAIKRQIALAAIAMPWLIKNTLQQQQRFHQVSKLLDKQTLAQLKQSEHPALALSSQITQSLSRLLKQASLAPWCFLKIEQERLEVIDAMGSCERISKTPMPFVMAVKSRRFILLFLVILPFALVNVSRGACPLISGLVAYALFSLDQIGLELQNPFSEKNLSHLPLDTICHNIQKELMLLLDNPPPLTPQKASTGDSERQSVADTETELAV